MSQIECTNCGIAMKSSELTCALCGYKRKLDFNLAGMSNKPTPEPPVEKWKEELHTEKTFSKESLEEVKEEFENRKRSQRNTAQAQKKRKKNRRKNTRSYSSNKKSFRSQLHIWNHHSHKFALLGLPIHRNFNQRKQVFFCCEGWRLYQRLI